METQGVTSSRFIGSVETPTDQFYSPVKSEGGREGGWEGREEEEGGRRERLKEGGEGE